MLLCISTELISIIYNIKGTNNKMRTMLFTKHMKIIKIICSVCLFSIATYSGIYDGNNYGFRSKSISKLVDVSVSPNLDHAIASYITYDDGVFYGYAIKLIDNIFEDVTIFSYYPYFYFEVSDKDYTENLKVLKTEWIDNTHVKIYATIYNLSEMHSTEPVMDEIIIVDIEEAKRNAN